MAWAKPSEENHYLQQHVAILLQSFTHWTGQPLLAPELSLTEQARKLFFAPFVVLSHTADRDPVFTYGNQAAMALFEVSWEELTQMPSRRSTESMHQSERDLLLTTVAKQGYMENCQGIRISKTGHRFMIQNVTVWNLLDEFGAHCGQAAIIRDWKFLENGE